MNNACLIIAGLAAGLLAGCSHKTDAKTELEKAETVLDQGQNASAPPAPVPEPQPSAPATPAPAPEPVAGLAATPAQEMHLAIAAYKTGELEDAVTRLQRLRSTPTLTPQQRMAVQDSVAAVMMEIYTLASKGDTKAMAAVKQYELMQTSQ